MRSVCSSNCSTSVRMLSPYFFSQPIVWMCLAFKCCCDVNNSSLPGLTNHTSRVQGGTSVLGSSTSACNQTEAHSDGRHAAVTRLGNATGVDGTDQSEGHDHLCRSRNNSVHVWDNPCVEGQGGGGAQVDGTVRHSVGALCVQRHSGPARAGL